MLAKRTDKRNKLYSTIVMAKKKLSKYVYTT